MKTILLYGATGFSGRVIAREAKEQGMSTGHPNSRYRMILAGRDGGELVKLAKLYGMEARIFTLENGDEIARGLHGVDVVINAAGPFMDTAKPLAIAAIKSRCHYVDINGEAPAYKALSELSDDAAVNEVAIVRSAASCGGVSNLLLEAALDLLTFQNVKALGAIRIAVLAPKLVAKGSVISMLRILHDHVDVFRTYRDCFDPSIIREPVGKLERLFDFAARCCGDRKTASKHLPEIATAANLIDARIAVDSAIAYQLPVQRIEAYIQLGRAGRAAYQLAALFAKMRALPPVRMLADAQIDAFFLCEPTQKELAQERHAIVLEIEDSFRTPLIDWRLETPNVYQFTAQLALGAAAKVVEGKHKGLVSLGQLLQLSIADLESNKPKGVLTGCSPMERRRVPLKRMAV